MRHIAYIRLLIFLRLFRYCLKNPKSSKSLNMTKGANWDTSQFHIPTGTVPSLTKPYHPDAIGKATNGKYPQPPEEGN